MTHPDSQLGMQASTHCGTGAATSAGAATAHLCWQDWKHRGAHVAGIGCAAQELVHDCSQNEGHCAGSTILEVITGIEKACTGMHDCAHVFPHNEGHARENLLSAHVDWQVCKHEDWHWVT